MLYHTQSEKKHLPRGELKPAPCCYEKGTKMVGQANKWHADTDWILAENRDFPRSAA